MPGKKKPTNETLNRNLIKETFTVFTHEINQLLKQSNINIPKSYIINVKLGEKRCFGRKWRDEHDREPDINYRCTNGVSEESDLCLVCINKIGWIGRVTERPKPELIMNYANRFKKAENDPNVDYQRKIIESLKLHDHDEFKSKKQLIGKYEI